MSVDLTRVSYSSDTEIDRVVGIKTLTYTKSQFAGFSFGGIGFNDVNNEFEGHYLEFSLIFSIDGGSTWIDSGIATSSSYSVEPPLSIGVQSDGAILILTFYQPSLIGGGGNLDILMKVVLLAVPSLAEISEVQMETDETISFAYTTEDNYLKIFSRGSYSFDNGSSRTETITHNLGYRPIVKVSYTGVDGRSLFPGTSDKIEVNSTQLIIATASRSPGESITVDYVIYYDKAEV